MIVPQSPKKTCELQPKGITVHVLQSVKVNLGRKFEMNWSQTLLSILKELLLQCIRC